MTSVDLPMMREVVERALSRCVPPSCDARWIEDFVDPPRFGWDAQALDIGFFAPVHAVARQHPARLRPVVASTLLESLGLNYQEFGTLLAVLELEHLAGVMLDGMRNGRDLATSGSDQVPLPLPTWLTVAYNLRQLCPVLVARLGTPLQPARQRWLVRRFTRHLFGQGLGKVLEVWGAQEGLTLADEKDFVDHLRVYLGALTFGLVCDVVSAAAGLDEEAATQLRSAGVDLGVALRLSALARGEDGTLRVGDLTSAEETIGWRPPLEPERLLRLATDLHRDAVRTAGEIPAVGGQLADAIIGLSTVLDPALLDGVRS